MPHRTITIAPSSARPWTVTITESTFAVTQHNIDAGAALLQRWAARFPVEHTLAQKRFGVPSLMVRLDCAINNGRLAVYEIEERPAGVGICSIVNPLFRERLNEISAHWPAFVVLTSPQREEVGDDYLWANVVHGYPDALKNGTAVLVRAEPNEREFHEVAERSISSVREKGNKSYGVPMGLWHRVSTSQDLPWDLAFCVKPCVGSKMAGVEIWDPLKRHGHSTRSRIERTMIQYGSMYCQSFIPPYNTGLPDRPYGLLRLFYGYHVPTRTWAYIAGHGIARNNVRGHGAADALTGAVRVVS